MTIAAPSRPKLWHSPADSFQQFSILPLALLLIRSTEDPTMNSSLDGGNATLLSLNCSVFFRHATLLNSSHSFRPHFLLQIWTLTRHPTCHITMKCSCVFCSFKPGYRKAMISGPTRLHRNSDLWSGKTKRVRDGMADSHQKRRLVSQDRIRNFDLGNESNHIDSMAVSQITYLLSLTSKSLQGIYHPGRSMF